MSATGTLAPPPPERVKPSLFKWLSGITLGVGLIALAWKMYSTTEPWLSVGIVGAIGAGIIGGMIFAGIENKRGGGVAGMIIGLVINAITTVVAGFVADWWALLFFPVCFTVTFTTYYLYSSYVSNDLPTSSRATDEQSCAGGEERKWLPRTRLE